jgi:hypothetical protein
MVGFVEQIAICRVSDNLRQIKKSEQITASKRLFSEAVERAFCGGKRNARNSGFL